MAFTQIEMTTYDWSLVVLLFSHFL